MLIINVAVLIQYFQMKVMFRKIDLIYKYQKLPWNSDFNFVNSYNKTKNHLRIIKLCNDFGIILNPAYGNFTSQQLTLQYTLFGFTKYFEIFSLKIQCHKSFWKYLVKSVVYENSKANPKKYFTPLCKAMFSSACHLHSKVNRCATLIYQHFVKNDYPHDSTIIGRGFREGILAK